MATAAELGRRHPPAGTPISGQQAADLFCQAAYRRSRGNGAKMVQLLQDVAQLLPRTGGAIHLTGAECHPHVPGCNAYMAQWQQDFLAAIAAHVGQVKV